MIRKRLLRNAFLLLILVALLDKIALALLLYWTLHYFDSGVHFFAGMVVGFGSLWLYLGKKETMTSRQIFQISLLGAILVGVVWEIFELMAGITFLSDGIHYVTDTGSDLLMDILGSLVAALYARNLFNKNQPH